MGMDGLSMSNTGMLREATSKDYSLHTEESIQKNDFNKQVDKMETQMRVKEDGRNNSSKKEQNKQKNKEDSASVYEKSDNETNIDETYNIPYEALENHSFYVKMVNDGEIFELYDKENNRLVEKISANEVTELINKLNLASGILVNRSV